MQQINFALTKYVNKLKPREVTTCNIIKLLHGQKNQLRFLYKFSFECKQTRFMILLKRESLEQTDHVKCGLADQYVVTSTSNV